MRSLFIHGIPLNKDKWDNLSSTEEKTDVAREENTSLKTGRMEFRVTFTAPENQNIKPMKK